METQKYFANIKELQKQLLEFITSEANAEEMFQNLNSLFDSLKIHQIKNELKLFLRLLSKIANNHYRTNDFFNKIGKIINIFKAEISNSFSNEEIFQIFQENKRLLLFLIDEKIMIFDKAIYDVIKKQNKTIFKVGQYEKYFIPEIKQFLNDKSIITEEDFEEKRRIGENENYICELIRKDSIDEFIVYINKTNYKIKKERPSSDFRMVVYLDEMYPDQYSSCATIERSVFETNPFLYDKYRLTLIEYAAFYGSVQIFKYLYKNGIKLTKPLWEFAVHGDNAEIIHILEDNGLKPDEKSLKESIKCHHIDVTNYILNNYQISDSFNKLAQCLKNFNFLYIEDNQVNNLMFLDLCKYDYCSLVEILLKINNFDINRLEKRGKKELRPFHIAIMKGNKEIVKQLISSDKLDINSKIITYFTTKEIDEPEDIFEEKTALQIAIENNDLETFQILLSNNKINVNIKSKTYYEKEKENTYLEKTPLFIAIECGNLTMIQQLLSKEDIEINERSRFIVDCVIKGVMRENPWKWWLVQEKSKWSKWDDEESLDEGQDDLDDDLYQWKDDYESSALHLAVEKGNLEIVQLLLSSSKIDVNLKDKKYSKMDAIAPSDRDQDYGYHYSEDSEKTALYIAIENANVKIVQQLLSREDIDVNIKCKIKPNKERAPLHLSAFLNNVEITSHLVNHKGIDIDIADEKGNTPAKYTKNKQIIQLLKH